MHEKNKWAFWGLALAAAAIVCVPSTMLLTGLGGYRRFLEGFQPSVLRPTHIRSIPHRGSGSQDDAPDLDFVEFRLKEKRAKEVVLVGDFNAWKEGSLKLARRGGGVWELALPLPRGRYRYYYLVDGKPLLDPKAPAGDRDGNPVSIKEVK
jgi:hypothetical protein